MHDFDEFYRSSHLRLLRQVVLVTADPAEAEDLLQEAYVRASMRWDALVTYEAPEAWVRRVAINLAANRAKRLRRRPPRCSGSARHRTCPRSRPTRSTWPGRWGRCRSGSGR